VLPVLVKASLSQNRLMAVTRVQTSVQKPSFSLFDGVFVFLGATSSTVLGASLHRAHRSWRQSAGERAAAVALIQSQRYLERKVAMCEIGHPRRQRTSALRLLPTGAPESDVGTARTTTAQSKDSPSITTYTGAQCISTVHTVRSTTYFVRTYARRIRQYQGGTTLAWGSSANVRSCSSMRSSLGKAIATTDNKSATR
jgi:hypothetical protein